MLKLATLTVFLFISGASFAQITSPRSSTKFDKFIKLQKIQWAAYTNNTLNLDTYNLNDDLYKRFQNSEINISLPLSRDSLMAGNSIFFLNKTDLAKLSYAPGLSPSTNEQLKPTNRVDSNSALLNVEEILYVTNGKLHSYIPWISPKISVYTSRNHFIGTAEYFSSCINTKYNFAPSKRDKLIFINSTKKKIVPDGVPQLDMLKQLYGINILEAIWDDILNEKNEIRDLINDKIISLKDLNPFFYTNSIIIPLYDSLGMITGTRSYQKPISPSLFPKIEILQDWYYDKTKNIVVNVITAITLFVSNNNLPANNELVPAIKIIFK